MTSLRAMEEESASRLHSQSVNLAFLVEF